MSASTNLNVSEPTLTVQEKIGYGLGDTASNFYWKLFENFQLYFYTDVFGISAAAAATMFFVTKLWDAINDPIVGIIADRTRTAWGRFRPYLLWMAVPFALTGILTFYTPDLSPRGKLIYAYITYTAVFMAYTAINIPYGALLGVISSNSLERTSASTYRFICAFLGGVVVQKFTEPLVAFFGGTKMIEIGGVATEVIDKQTGFFWTVVCYSIAAIILFVICFLSTKERVQPIQTQNSSLFTDISDLLANRPWLSLVAVGLFQILADWTRGSATPYYFTYYVNSNFGNFLVAGTFASITGMLLTKQLTKIFGKRWLMIIMHVLKALITAAFFLLPPNQVALMYVLHIAAAFVSGPIPILLWSMYADVADYSEWKNERRATGLVFSAATFSQKLGGALGAAVPGWALSYYGFIAPIDNVNQVQSQHTIDGIIVLMSLAPAVFLGGAIAGLCFYNLTDDFLGRIETDLRERKAAVSV